MKEGWKPKTDKRGFLRDEKEPCVQCGWSTKWLDRNDTCEECYKKIRITLK